MLTANPAGESTGSARLLDFDAVYRSVARLCDHLQREPRAGSSEKPLQRSTVEMIGSPIVTGRELQ